MRFIELFAGIGGFRLGLERAGHQCVWANEIDPYSCKVYRNNWPDGALSEGDIRTIDPATIPAHDLLCAGFPCQPVSLAGRQKAQADTRWLWPEVARIFRATQPRWLLLENVPGLLSANDGGAFAEVLRDLAQSGFDVEWDAIPAAALGAPHLRYRVFILAHAGHGSRRPIGTTQKRNHPSDKRSTDHHAPDRSSQESSLLADALRGGCNGESRNQGQRSSERGGIGPNRQDVADTTGKRFKRSQSQAGRGNGKAQSEEVPQTDRPARGRPVLADSQIESQRTGLCTDGPAGERRRRSIDSGRSGSLAYPQQPGLEGYERFFVADTLQRRHHANTTGSGWWAAEPRLDRVAYGIPNRIHRLKCLGNAVVPQVIEWIGQRLKEIEEAGSKPC